MVCWASHVGGGFLFVRTPDSRGSFEVSGIALNVGHISCVAMLARSSGEANLGYLPEASCLGEQWTMYNFASRAE
jgi:hypothetical protein